MNDIYRDDTYWTRHSTFHEADASFKADGCYALCQQHELTSPGTVLDVGCGSGKFLHHLSTRITGDFLGVDISATPIERATALYSRSNVRFEVLDVQEITDHFGLVTMNDVLEHVDDYIGFLRSIRHLGDRFYFNIPLDMHVLSVLRHRYMYTRKEVGHLHYFSKPSALATLEHAGYTIIGSRYNRTVFHDLRVHPSIRHYVAALPRLISYTIAADLSVHLLGGASLGVLCEAS